MVRENTVLVTGRPAKGLTTVVYTEGFYAISMHGREVKITTPNPVTITLTMPAACSRS